MKLLHTYTTANEYWQEGKTYEMSEKFLDIPCDCELKIDTKETYQTLDENPWGGCFADRGFMAMDKLSKEKRIEIIKSFYGPEGLKFTAARLPIGNSDYSDTHKSYDEHNDDYDMKYFSLKTDETYLLPYIKTALEINPDINFFATPWSPPSWMKMNNSIHGIDEDNRIIFTPEILKSYAKYFVKYIQEYKKRGINIKAVTPQNEPTMNTAYASCIWTGEQLNIFIRDYLYPEFKENNINTEIWLGTFTDSNAAMVIPTLEDEESAKIVDAVCFQWWGAPLAKAVKRGYGKKLIQSETKCGDGKNDWQYAEEQFDCFKEFFESGVQSYYLWNMVLDEKGGNTAEKPWCQNAPITVNSVTNEVAYNPSYYLTKHFSYYIKPGAKRIKIDGYKDSIAFLNADGEMILEVKNSSDESKNIVVICENNKQDIVIKPHSINTLRIIG